MENLLLVVFISSFLMIWAIVKLAKSKHWLVNEVDLQGVQKFHSMPTPRIAGIPVFISFFIGLWLVDLLEPSYIVLLLASLPVFFGGLLEDITAKVSPTKRMAATFISIVILFFMGDITISFLGYDWIDHYLSNNIILSLLFTMLVVGGWLILLILLMDIMALCRVTVFLFCWQLPILPVFLATI